MSKFMIIISCIVASYMVGAATSPQTHSLKLNHVSTKYKQPLLPELIPSLRLANEKAYYSLKDPYLVEREPSFQSSSSSKSKSPFKVVTDDVGTTKFFLNDDFAVAKVQYLQDGGKITKVVDADGKPIKYMIADKNDANLWIHKKRKSWISPTVTKRTKLIKDETTGTSMLLESDGKSKNGDMYSVKWVEDSQGHRYKFSGNHKKHFSEWANSGFSALAKEAAPKTAMDFVGLGKSRTLKQIKMGLMTQILQNLEKMKGKAPNRSMQVFHSVIAAVVVTLVSAAFIQLNEIEEAVSKKYIYYSEEIPKNLNSKVDQWFPESQDPKVYLRSNPELHTLSNILGQNQVAVAA